MKNGICGFVQTVVALSAALGLAGGCRSFAPWPAGTEDKLIPPVLTDQTLTLPREGMVFRKISPAQHARDRPDFFMLETEVANGMYSKYLRATAQTKNDYAVYDRHIAEIVQESKTYLRQQSREHWYSPHYGSTGPLDASSARLMNRMVLWDGQHPRFGQEVLPVTLVTVQDAEDFCAWLTSLYPELGTFRLPTDVEWLIAAYGKDRNYPWGNDWRPDAFHHTRRTPPPAETNSMEQWAYDHFEETSPEPVKWRPEGRTPEGLYGMWGNAQEMVIHPSNVANAVFLDVGTRWMGGSFKDASCGDCDRNSDYPFQPRADYWGFTHSTRTKEPWLGFRVVLDPHDKEHRFQPRAPYNVNASW